MRILGTVTGRYAVRISHGSQRRRALAFLTPPSGDPILGLTERCRGARPRLGWTRRSAAPGPTRPAGGAQRTVPEVDVRLVDVVKKFGDAVAVDHIDLEVRDGEFFSLLGPSGCGKTTTLRMIGGFEQPTSGLIELQGQDVTWLPPFKRNVNTVFQNYALFPHLTIFENVAFGLRRKGVKDAEVKTPGHRHAQARRAARLRAPQADPDLGRPGAARRARPGAINRPAVLLLDEPLGALDLKLRKQMQVELKRIQQEVGITFIYVTHDQEEAMTMSDRIAVMNNGPLRAAGRPGEPLRAADDALRRRASSASATCCRGDGRGQRRRATRSPRSADDTRVRVAAGARRRPDARSNVGVRPEKIRLHEATPRRRPATTA